MGITGLIPFLEKASSKVHLKDLRGCTIAVDTYCWLHKGVFSCAEKLVRGEQTDQYLLYCLKYVEMFLAYDIKPILVFDGRHLPAKALTESRRRESRKQSKRRAAELLRLGRTEEARSHMRRCVDVTHEMALQLIRECRLRNVDCIVAPYEADAQLAWLNKVELAQYVVTEDSDLTLFGARKVIFKLDLAGGGLLVEADKLYLAMGCRPEKYTFDKFRRMCILSGCDYLDSLPGIGLAKACKFMLKTAEDDMWRALKKLPQYLNLRHLEVDDDYIENFLKAEATFKHMYIYNPLQRRMERLYPLEDFNTDERYCVNAGSPLEDDEQALQLALGNLNPFTLKQMDNWHPDRNFGLAQATKKHIKRAKHKSIWQANFRPQSNQERESNKNTANCAIFFKKVDFISKTINEEISANLREDNEKPEEAEIFSMYKYGATAAKRRRSDSDDCLSSGDDFESPKPAITKPRHNPFMKTNTDKNLQRSPVCEHGSLLRVLSPQKCSGVINQQPTRKNGFKRSIFASALEPEKQVQLEIKSRFFAANVRQVAKQQQEEIEFSPNLVEEIDAIESLSQQQRENQAQLYNSPSTKTVSLKTEEEVTPSYADSGIGSIATVSTLHDEVTEDMQANRMQVSESIASFNVTETEQKAVNGEATEIVLSDDDDDDAACTTSSASTSSVINTPSQISALKTQIGRPRMGLSRPKGKRNTKLTKITTTNAAESRQQTRLSMFGFQKKKL